MPGPSGSTRPPEAWKSGSRGVSARAGRPSGLSCGGGRFRGAGQGRAGSLVAGKPRRGRLAANMTADVARLRPSAPTVRSPRHRRMKSAHSLPAPLRSPSERRERDAAAREPVAGRQSSRRSAPVHARAGTISASGPRATQRRPRVAGAPLPASRRRQWLGRCVDLQTYLSSQ